MTDPTTAIDRIESRLGPLAVRSSGDGPPLVFFAGALANGEIWRDVVAGLEDRYRCITVDLPLGSHRWPLLSRADRSATSVASLLPEALELLDVGAATVVANDTAGGLLLLALAGAHPGLDRIGRLVLINCDSYDHFPPAALRRAAAVCRTTPRLARAALRMQARSAAARQRTIASVSARGLDERRAESLFRPARRDPAIAADLVAAMAGFRPQLLLDAATVIPTFEKPVLLVWGDACEFFPVDHAQRLAAAFPNATLRIVDGAKTWVAVDNPKAVIDAIGSWLMDRS